MTHRIEPLTATTSAVECQWLFPPEALERPGFDPAYAVDFWDLTNRQDWAAVESVQRGMASPRFVPGLLSTEEDAVYHFVTMVAGATSAAPWLAARPRACPERPSRAPTPGAPGVTQGAPSASPVRPPGS